VRFETLYLQLVNANSRRKPTPRIRVVIADDHRLFGQALEAVLTGEERFEVVGYARNGREAVDLFKELQPDVTLMDISMPVLDGVEATREIRKLKPDACILMLTGSNSETDVNRARKAGAAGYVTKDRLAGELIEAIIEIVQR
jgi:DNA-binding NarL/FixJ family response regulator